jgi:hypothetical protein
VVDHGKIGFNAPAGTNEDFYLWTAAKYGQPFVLRGTAEQLVVNFNPGAPDGGAQTMTGGTCSGSVKINEVLNYN